MVSFPSALAGKAKIAALTRQNVPRRLVIRTNGTVVAAATIQGEMSGGSERFRVISA